MFRIFEYADPNRNRCFELTKKYTVSPRKSKIRFKLQGILNCCIDLKQMSECKDWRDDIISIGNHIKGHVRAVCWSRPAARKIELKLVHRNRRMEFARQYLNTPQEVWDAVIWMDEKTFSSAEDGRYRVWRPDGQRLNPNYVLPLAQSGRIVIGFWGCMSSRGLLRLQEISPRMDAEEYVEILEEVLKPSARQIFPEEEFPTIKIVQDNSGVHSSRLVQAWFDANPDFERIPWPAKSPDLNVIENVWAKMKTSWIAGQLRTKEALRIHVYNVWNELSLEPNFTRNLVNSMQRRLQLVLESNGFWIPY